MKKNSILIVLLVLVLDLLSKHYAQIYLEHSLPMVIIPNFFELTYVVNTGAAWSILQGQKAFFIIISIVVSFALVYYIYQEDKRILIIALSLMLGGTLGNLYDRIFHGHVRDMLSFYIFSYPFPVFNIADSALVIGVALIILEMIISERRSLHE